ncbi:TolC family protein [Nibrella saemangeumensis]|uniref:TolC family protein n=1 Tax=Nibrella saemangeumensis TaxID=1084526 RepID=A0ABP8MBX5_9BACT
MKRVAMMRTVANRLFRSPKWLAGVLLVSAAYAQPTQSAGPNSNRFSLRQAIDIALQNNLTVKQGQLQVQNSDLQFYQAKMNRIPTLNAFGSQAFSSGRNINPTTNTFVERAVSSNNYQLSTSVTVFNGFAIQNNIKQTDLFLQSSEESLKATQNTVALTVVQNYLNVLNNEDQLDIARRQVEATRGQVERTQRLVNAGTVAEATLYDIRAQLANDELAIVNAQNNLDLAKLALLQTMNLPGTGSPGAIEVERIQFDDPAVAPYTASPQQVYETALGIMPEIKAAELRVKSDALGIDVARASMYPSLTLNGNLSTLYSSVGLQRLVSDGTLIQQPVPGLFVNMNGTPQQVFQTQQGGTFVPYAYGEQLRNNLNRSVSLNLRIPIFNNMQARTRVTSATITKQNSEIAADNARLQLRQQIEQAYTNMLASANRYRATQVQVASLEQAFRAAESRLNAGALNSVDYNIAKTNLDRSRANLVQAKYDYIFRTKILDFYQNKPLSF